MERKTKVYSPENRGLMMKCGHAAQGFMDRLDGIDLKPPLHACVICSCVEVEENPADLSGRTAKCASCQKNQPSDPQKLAFFEHVPSAPFDRYYCGCRGWD